MTTETRDEIINRLKILESLQNETNAALRILNAILQTRFGLNATDPKPPVTNGPYVQVYRVYDGNDLAGIEVLLGDQWVKLVVAEQEKGYQGGKLPLTLRRVRIC